MGTQEQSITVVRVKSGQERPYADTIDVWRIVFTRTDYKGGTVPGFMLDSLVEVSGIRSSDHWKKLALMLTGLVRTHQTKAEWSAGHGDADVHFRGYVDVELKADGFAEVTSVSPNND